MVGKLGKLNWKIWCRERSWYFF